MSELGFDEGALFHTMSKPKHVIEKFKYNEDGTVKSKKTTTISYWDAVMAVGGPTLVFTIWYMIQRLGKLGDWYEENVRGDPTKERLFKIGGPGLLWVYENRREDMEKIVVSTAPISGWMAQIADAWGLVDMPDLMEHKAQSGSMLSTHGRGVVDTVGHAVSYVSGSPYTSAQTQQNEVLRFAQRVKSYFK